MKKITPSTIKRVEQIIQEHLETLNITVLGNGKISPRLAKKLGINSKLENIIETAYKYGKLSSIKRIDKMDLRKLVSKVKLNNVQDYNLSNIKLLSEQSLNTLAQKTTSKLISTIIQEQLSFPQMLSQEAKNALENNITPSELANKLRDITQDTLRDWNRVANTEMWTAKCRGEVDSILSGDNPTTSKGKDTMVFIRPSPDACNKCKQLYLERDGVTPRVFKLEDLINNGSNYGKKQSEWQAVVPPLHPNCICSLNVKPDDTIFDKNGNLVYNSDNDLESR